MTWLLLVLACAASAQAPGVATPVPPLEVAGVPATYAAGALLFSVVLVGVLAGSGSAVLKLWREFRQGDKDQDAAIAKLEKRLATSEAEIASLRALVYGKESGVKDAKGPGLAGHLHGEDYGGTGEGIIGAVKALQAEASGRAEREQPLVDRIQKILARHEQGATDEQG